jgi:NNP family nitrate/nitrite transporter-like MFS transporter
MARPVAHRDANAPPVPGDRPHWRAFGLVCLAYLAATTGEALLSPVFPVAADDLGLDLALGGIAFGTLTATIAVANLVGGALLPRFGAARLIGVAMVFTAFGGLAAAGAPSFAGLLLAQVLLGAGSGLSFPAGLQAVGLAAGPHRRGFAMGIYGVAFSGGLTLAAVLGALGAGSGWRLPFLAATVLAVAAGISTLWLDLPKAISDGRRTRLAEVLGVPTAVGSVGAVCQYGTVSFLTTFAVAQWGLTAAAAAVLLAAGRVLSIVAKLVSGASADRVGPRVSARRTAVVLTATGLAWTLLPGSPLVYALAAVFAGTVSSLFPIANLLAVERFGQRGGALGVYRSVQIAVGAAAGVAMGVVGEAVGLRPVVLVTVLLPLTLFWVCRDRT